MFQQRLKGLVTPSKWNCISKSKKERKKLQQKYLKLLNKFKASYNVLALGLQYYWAASGCSQHFFSIKTLTQPTAVVQWSALTFHSNFRGQNYRILQNKTFSENSHKETKTEMKRQIYVVLLVDGMSFDYDEPTILDLFFILIKHHQNLQWRCLQHFCQFESTIRS